ncbi:MAG TPA: ABC-2 family transporter protein [Chloroflexota bacterium]
MKRLLKVYRAQLRTTIAIQLQYRAELAIWLIGLVLQPVIYLIVWSTVAGASGGSVGGYTRSDFAAYFIVLMLVNHLTFTWVIYGMDARIRQGTFSPMLLRPVHPIHVDIADNVTYKLLTLSVMIPATIALILIFRPTLHPAPWAVVAFIPALLLAFVLRFVVEWTIAMVAFWISRMNAIDQMYYVGVLFLSGQVAPLSLFPAPIRIVASILPFRWIISFPVELLLGRVTLSGAIQGFAAQGLWIGVMFLAFAGMWRTGIARYSAVGT